MRTRESEEMYLETILLISKRKPDVHSVDIVDELGYAKSSVSRGVNLLQSRGYITMDPTGRLELTANGKEKAENIYDRHRILTALLTRIGADSALAEENACRIEHVISAELFDIIKRFVAEDKNE